MRFDLRHGDSREVLQGLSEGSVDALVTDPPAGISFMGKSWDGAAAFREQMRPIFAECLRVLKPGAHGLVWALPRTSHWTATALEDAGFEIRDRVSHLFGTGFPKSLDVSKAIDKRAEENVETTRKIAAVASVIRSHREAKGLTPQQVSEAILGTPSGACWNWEHIQLPSLENWASLKAVLGIPDRFDGLVAGDRSRFIEAEREVIGVHAAPATRIYSDRLLPESVSLTAPATLLAQQWEGWGTALKPACEDWWLVRRPLDGTVAANVAAHGTGALNIDGCRIGLAGDDDLARDNRPGENGWKNSSGGPNGAAVRAARGDAPLGRWPANVTLDEEAAALLDEQSGESASVVRESEDRDDGGVTWALGRSGVTPRGHNDTGGASRFFYVAKPDRAERDIGCEDLAPATGGEATSRQDGSAALKSPRTGAGRGGGARNIHPTVKSVDLMRWLCRLITPRGGLVLDPFMGSGSTGVACSREGLRFIGIERERAYFEIAKRRICGDAPLLNGAVLRLDPEEAA